MDSIQRKEFIDMKLSKLITAIRENRKASCTNKPWGLNLSDIEQVKPLNYSSNYEHRYLAQKEIIKCQKGTITKQEKMIEQMQNEIARQKNELSLLKINENVKKTPSKKVEAKSEVTSRSCTPARFPNVLQRMQQREEERRQRWEAIREQKALKERIRLEEAALKEIETKRQIAAQKKLKFLQVSQRMREIEEQRIHDRRIKEAAIRFYDKFTLMIYFSIWWIESRETKARLVTASFAVNKHFMSLALRDWKISTHIAIDIKQNAAKNLYRRTNMKRHILFWQSYCQQMKCYDESAVRVLQKELMASAFRRWHIYCLKIQIEQEEKFQAARSIYFMSMYKHYFKMWREVPKRVYERREQEKRIREWQSSVQQIIPDFQIQE